MVGGVVPWVVVDVGTVGGVVTLVVVDGADGVVGGVVEAAAGAVVCAGNVLGTVMGFNVVRGPRAVVGGDVGVVSVPGSVAVVGGIDVSNDGSGGNVESSAIRCVEHDTATRSKPTPNMLAMTMTPVCRELSGRRRKGSPIVPRLLRPDLICQVLPM